MCVVCVLPHVSPRIPPPPSLPSSDATQSEIHELGSQTHSSGVELKLPPIIAAQVGEDPAKKTLLVYGHYDVQPAEKRCVQCSLLFSWFSSSLSPFVSHSHTCKVSPPPFLRVSLSQPQSSDTSPPPHLSLLPFAHPESDGWDTEPFELVEKDGKLWGRGSTDDKAPSECMSCFWKSGCVKRNS